MLTGSMDAAAAPERSISSRETEPFQDQVDFTDVNNAAPPIAPDVE